jgi:phasin family protein
MEQIEKTTQGMMKACEDASAMARDHLDAAMKSAAVMSKGMEQIASQASGLFKESMERTMNAGKTMMSAKNPKEIADLHSELVKDVFDCWVAGTGKISEISARMTQDAMAPMAEQTNNTISKIAQKAKAA